MTFAAISAAAALPTDAVTIPFAGNAAEIVIQGALLAVLGTALIVGGLWYVGTRLEARQQRHHRRCQ